MSIETPLEEVLGAVLMTFLKVSEAPRNKQCGSIIRRCSKYWGMYISENRQGEDEGN